MLLATRSKPPALQGVLNVVRAVDSDVSEEAVELRHNIGMLLLPGLHGAWM
ncbi:hypothetical protein [Streptomyces mirabilis]|uniref:hypothetical protein n=1 Tax=Streptomyces mirabilis TaxID=68239 RepID=UPI003331EEAE